MRIMTMLATAMVVVALTQSAGAQQPSAAVTADAATKIVGVVDNHGKTIPTIGLGERLFVKLSGTATLDPASYVLFIDGRPIVGLDDTLFDRSAHALVFELQHNDRNALAWKALLGRPTRLTMPVTVSLGLKPTQGAAIPSVFGDSKNDVFRFVVIPLPRVLGAGLFVIAVIGVLWIGARRSNWFRDNLLPQLAPWEQTYSLGRWQMAFWFTLIFVSFVTLFIVLWDIPAISNQALALMGISAATGFASIQVDRQKDSPADAANRGLQALGLNTYADVVRTRDEIKERQAQIAANPAPATAQKLALEIQDRELLLRAYADNIKTFVSEGWLKDMTTDMNGGALHRWQAFIWTWALGAVFLFEVYVNLTIPQFDSSLLVVMGISSAGYVGFKYPEPQQ